jgi:HSP20 family protein
MLGGTFDIKIWNGTNIAIYPLKYIIKNLKTLIMTNTISNPSCKTETNSLNHLPNHLVKFRKSPAMQSRTSWSPNRALTNIKSLKDAYIIELAIPGFSKEHVNITLENSKLKITGSKTSQDVKFIKREYQFNQFEKVFSLPENVDDASLLATMENGILKVHIQVIPAKEAQTITIN